MLCGGGGTLTLRRPGHEADHGRARCGRTWDRPHAAYLVSPQSGQRRTTGVYHAPVCVGPGCGHTWAGAATQSPEAAVAARDSTWGGGALPELECVIAGGTPSVLCLVGPSAGRLRWPLASPEENRVSRGACARTVPPARCVQYTPGAGSCPRSEGRVHQARTPGGCGSHCGLSPITGQSEKRPRGVRARLSAVSWIRTMWLCVLGAVTRSSCAVCSPSVRHQDPDTPLSPMAVVGQLYTSELVATRRH